MPHCNGKNAFIRKAYPCLVINDPISPTSIFANHIEEGLALFMFNGMQGPLKGRADLGRILHALTIPPAGLAKFLEMNGRFQIAQWKLL